MRFWDFFSLFDGYITFIFGRTKFCTVEFFFVRCRGSDACTFVIDPDGSVTDVQVARSIDPSLDKEAVRVLSKMPKWKPGMHKGQPVRVKYTVPVTFKLQ